MNTLAMRTAKAAIVVVGTVATSWTLYLHYGATGAGAHGSIGAIRTSAAPANRPGAADAHELRVLEAAAQKKPDHIPVLFKMATLAEASGRLPDARKYLDQILSVEPKNPEARIELGKLLFETGDVAGALENTRLVLQTQPDNPDALYNLGAIYANIGNEQLAREQWIRLTEISPSSESGRKARQSLEQLQQAPRESSK